MTQTRHNLLDDPIFSVRMTTQGEEALSLPEILAALAHQELADFLRVQAHQRQSFYCFLTQLGAIALTAHAESTLPAEPDIWRALLLELTDGAQEPWCLWVEDVTAPAFLQVPLATPDLQAYSPEATTPDELDILVTSKSHDVKMTRVLRPSPEHWVQSLINQQTLEGQMGRGNYGIARMNGGFGSRPFASVTSSRGWSPRFRSDVMRLLESYDAFFQDGFYTRQGPSLLWTLPWDGGKKSGLLITSLDPYFIEVCRRLRMVNEGGELVCWKAPSQARRVVLPEGSNGVTYDPWAPIDLSDARKGRKVLTLSGQGLHYTLVSRLLFGENVTLPALAQISSFEQEAGLLLLQGMVRGQGKTEGLHQRAILIPKDQKRLWQNKESAAFRALAVRSQGMVQDAETMRRNVLFPALAALTVGGEQSGALDANQQAHVLRWTRSFDDEIDACFFEHLFDGSTDPTRPAWFEALRAMARRRLEEAIGETPVSDARYYHVISQAEGLFFSLMRRYFHDHFPPRDEEPS